MTTMVYPKMLMASRNNVSKGGPGTYDLTRRKVDKLMKQNPAVKEEMGKQIPRFKQLESITKEMVADPNYTR